jgi:hypothetical protein
MTEARRTPIPDGLPDAIPDEDDGNESSNVRARPRFEPSGDRDARSLSGEWSVAPPPSTRWLGDMVRTAKVLLADLPADHPRAQLLRMAIVRRDEVLLGRLIAELGGSPR